ncbi:helicase carboxy-terminal domain protein (macronuclear) [Tetrahymena thermophila SB210]|uniref:Helicase carboxy-terminal domain protein n=1 Tax=Tetrahymena thermophila (strain SB210) TaxID=312017 RepID=Q23BV3_TETTS|nr:helicase carboxy-terminal domain protein [Tetrahymena thermophila SB210]EAR94015.2 helicase carboxy-terminal domain protein [Tetrahymena thermophila SB210]|eukprot:XP_001014260.2 helicase carboxy-terminal domain protein [Tetrahymena thermophila SB210]
MQMSIQKAQINILINLKCKQFQMSLIINQIMKSKIFVKRFSTIKKTQELSQFLINIQKVSEQVSKFGYVVEVKLFEAFVIIKQTMGEELVFQLGNILKQNASGAQIVNQIPQFKSYRIDQFNELVGRHDINYILGKLQQCESGKIKQYLDGNLKEQLKQCYDTYLKKYEDTIQQYKYDEDKWEEIVDNVRQLSKQINLHSKKQKNEILHLLAQICAYWTLNESGKQKQDKKNIFKKPNHTQIISIIMLLGIHKEAGFWQGVKNQFQYESQIQLNNQLIEILTGEGKSITLGFCSIILALLGCEVDVVCYSNYLSERDDKDFRNLFISFGVSEKIKYGTFRQQVEKYINNNFNIRQATLDIVNSQTLDNNKNTKQNTTNYKILLIDEVDIFFNLDYYGQTQNPIVKYEVEEIKNIITEIWNSKGQQKSSIITNIEQSSSYKELMIKYPKFERLFKRHINKLAQDVNQVELHKNQKDYIVRNNLIGYKQIDSTIDFKFYYGYLTLFAYFLENSKGNINDQTLKQKTQLNLHCGHISYALLPDTYSAILGVTGTLQSLNSQMKECLKKYNFSTEIYIPSMFGDSKLDFRKGDMVKVEIDQENQYLQIQQISFSAIKQKQSVLIFFKDSQSLIDYHDSNYLYLPKENYIKVTDHNDSTEFNHQVQKATRSGQIGLFVREYGRGTDFISFDPNVIQSGGVVVIQTFLSDNITEEIQIKGRTARQGQQGQYYLILNQKDLIKDFGLQDDQIQQWKNNQNQKSLYDNLSEVRNVKENQRYEDIEKKINIATDSHQKTIQYIQSIKNGNYDQAINYINDNS